MFAFIRDRGAFGATADEAAAALGMPIQTTSPRLLELRQAGIVVDAGCERPTRWGAAARVYVVWDQVDGAPVDYPPVDADPLAEHAAEGGES